MQGGESGDEIVEREGVGLGEQGRFQGKEWVWESCGMTAVLLSFFSLFSPTLCGMAALGPSSVSSAGMLGMALEPSGWKKGSLSTLPCAAVLTPASA